MGRKILSGDFLPLGFLRTVAVGLMITPLVSACGFQPLYSTVGSSQTVQQMAAVEVTKIPGRVGQRVRNEIIFGLTGGGYPNSPNYRLEIILRKSQNSAIVDITGEASRHLFKLDADYKLVNLANDEVLFKASAHSQAPYDRFSSGFTNTRGLIDAQNRTSKVLGRTIKTRVAAYLSSAS